MTSDSERFLRRAIELAAQSRAGGDITAHPELKLARWAAQHLSAETAAGTTMYTSCQPCGMCTGAI